MSDRKREKDTPSSPRANGEAPGLPKPPPFDPDLSLIGDMQKAEKPPDDDRTG